MTNIEDGSRTTISRIIGALFLGGFLSYGIGSVLANSVASGTDFLSKVPGAQTTLILGAFLILLNTGVDVGKAVLLFPILENHGKRTALGYLATMIVEVCLLAIGALAILMIVPLGEHAAEPWANGVASLLVQTNLMAYNIAEASLGFGAIFLCALFFRTRLVPRWLAVSGLIGYPVLMAGMIAEIFGIHIGVQATIPGIVFELGLPIYLFIKGFNPEVYGGRAASRREATGIVQPAVHPVPAAL